FDASKDENTVVFTSAEQDKFEKLKHRIEQKMISNRTGIQQLSTSSNFDDLEKLANLRDKGIITEEEFQVKKRQLLGL
ncbi:MAG: SHOCT domain-containing protein, partial [Nostoc sp.]